MSDSLGEIAVSTKVDGAMSEFIEDEARQLGISRAEFVRRVLEFYRESQREETQCPWCEEPIVMNVET
ncbi:hypothetical protein [Haloglomus salinum]|uniref:hypothetical protein n=1 Tax=Haloglomus salinum TaxID=2962673 RepID=UPI0020CA12EA|nr:hypothetical protein [Haloglomus salinum]